MIERQRRWRWPPCQGAWLTPRSPALHGPEPWEGKHSSTYMSTHPRICTAVCPHTHPPTHPQTRHYITWTQGAQLCPHASLITNDFQTIRVLISVLANSGALHATCDGCERLAEATHHAGYVQKCGGIFFSPKRAWPHGSLARYWYFTEAAV